MSLRNFEGNKINFDLLFYDQPKASRNDLSLLAVDV